jgi:hypothetical protein
MPRDSFPEPNHIPRYEPRVVDETSSSSSVKDNERYLVSQTPTVTRNSEAANDRSFLIPSPGKIHVRIESADEVVAQADKLATFFSKNSNSEDRDLLISYGKRIFGSGFTLSLTKEEYKQKQQESLVSKITKKLFSKEKGSLSSEGESALVTRDMIEIYGSMIADFLEKNPGTIGRYENETGKIIGTPLQRETKTAVQGYDRMVV